MNNILYTFNKQKDFFNTNKTKDLDFRINALKKLKNVIKSSENDILDALNKDLRKSDFEGFTTEIGLVYEEINLHIKKLKKWSKKEKVTSSIAYFPARSYIYKEPYGLTLIIGPFNYPFQLVISPLIGAISAGNCAIIKPSENSPNTAKILENIINKNFDEDYIKIVDPLGGKETVSYLLDLKFDYIFFTGSVRVGKIIMEKAAKNLTPVTLELGGKSPCIIDETANIELSAKRIIWGKLINSGQTCVAPDYILVEKSIKNSLIEALKKEIQAQFSKDIKNNSDYPRIVNIEALNRLKSYLNDGNISFGGRYNDDDLYFEPTILTDIKEDSKVMKDEIFGPILPIIEYSSLEEAIEFVKSKEKPLALYYFSEDKLSIKTILNSLSFGGGCINDTIIHVASSYLPFGGVNSSGLGAYHGKASFDTFSHKKSIIKRGTFIEFPIRFAPYKNKISLVRKLFK